jgi:hypothetical protein
VIKQLLTYYAAALRLAPDADDREEMGEEDAKQWDVREGIIHHRMGAVNAKVSQVFFTGAFEFHLLTAACLTVELLKPGAVTTEKKSAPKGPYHVLIDT